LEAAATEIGSRESSFRGALEELRRLARVPSGGRIAEIEKVRGEVQTLADISQLRHLKTWHEELSGCPRKRSPNDTGTGKRRSN
jgi:hypothetical protein